MKYFKFPFFSEHFLRLLVGFKFFIDLGKSNCQTILHQGPFSSCSGAQSSIDENSVTFLKALEQLLNGP